MSVTEMVLETIQALPVEQQQQVLEYAQMLQQDKIDKGTERKPSSWRSHPAVGMWKDREDMKDSVEWVRTVRQQQWHNS